MTRTDPKARFRALDYTDGYLPIAAYGLIGDGASAALVGRDGTVAWLAVPRFDSDPLFCCLLDARKGGWFRIAPENPLEARQSYEPDTGVLVTEIRHSAGLIEITDALTLRQGADLSEDLPAGRGELLRRVRIVDGSARLHVSVQPRGGASSEPWSRGVRIRSRRHPELDLYLDATLPVRRLDSVFELSAGNRLDIVLRWGGHPHRRHVEASALLDATRGAWRRWMSHVTYEGPQIETVRRSAITLKMLDHFENGAMVAAPTSSLPERIGGVRNWDYRFAWVRDAAFSVYALRRVGLDAEAWAFLGWVLDAVERDDKPHVLYDLDGHQPSEESADAELEGYRGSAPVRWGNAAAHQNQHDAYGEMVDCAYQWVAAGGDLTPGLWDRLVALIESARQKWNEPDHGIWEVRTSGRVFTYSAAMCQVALERGARLAARFDLPGDRDGWAAQADRIGKAILDEAWDENRQALTEHLGGGGLDASILALPLRRVIDPRHPRMVKTVEAVTKGLHAGDGLLYRYLPDESPDGLPGHEGAFLLCSFWLVDNLAYQGRLDEATELYELLCGRANDLGLLPEQIDGDTGEFLGNFPQAFSHVGVISSGVNLARRLADPDG